MMIYFQVEKTAESLEQHALPVPTTKPSIRVEIFDSRLLGADNFIEQYKSSEMAFFVGAAELKIVYDSTLFCEERIKSIVDHMEAVLHSIAQVCFLCILKVLP